MECLYFFIHKYFFYQSFDFYFETKFVKIENNFRLILDLIIT